MDEWQQLQRQEQLLRKKHRHEWEQLQLEYQRRHTAQEEQFERDIAQLETARLLCMARMGSGPTAGSHQTGAALLQRPAVPALTAAPSPTWCDTEVDSPAASGAGSRSAAASHSSSQSDAAGAAISQDASQDLVSEAESVDYSEDDAISGLTSQDSSEDSGISLGQPAGGQHASQQAIDQTAEQQADSHPAHCEQQPSAVRAYEHLTPGSAIDAAPSSISPVPAGTSSEHAALSPAGSLPAAPSAAAAAAASAEAAQTGSAAGGVQIAVSQPGPPTVGRTKRVQPTRVGDAATQPAAPAPAAGSSSPVSGDGEAAAGEGLAAGGAAAEPATPAVPLAPAAVPIAEDSQMMAFMRSSVPGRPSQFLCNMAELAWPRHRAKVHGKYASFPAAEHISIATEELSLQVACMHTAHFCSLSAY